MSRTVKQLAEEVAALQAATPDTHVSSFFVWHWEQVAAVLEEYDRYGELTKLELTHAMSPEHKRSYHVIVWHHRLLNDDARAALKKKGYYAALEAHKDRLS